MPSIVGIILGGLGTATSAIGQIKAGNAAEATAQNNASVAVEEAGIKEQQQRMADSRIMAHARAVVGASGVEMSGSPLDVMAESARQAEMNALIIRRGGQLDAQGQLLQGAQAQSASRIAATGTILTGGARVGQQVAQLAGGRVSSPENNGTLPISRNPGGSVYG